MVQDSLVKRSHEERQNRGENSPDGRVGAQVVRVCGILRGYNPELDCSVWDTGERKFPREVVPVVAVEHRLGE